MKKRAKGCFTFLFKTVIFAVVITVVFSLLFRVILVDGESMLPTLQNGDWILVLKTKNIENSDIILTNTDNKYGLRIIKRAVAFSGDTVDIDYENSAVFVNGEKLGEDYILDCEMTKGDVEFPLTVPDGCIFVLGDNRGNSVDSRYSEMGFVEKEDVIGKVIFKLLPTPVKQID